MLLCCILPCETVGYTIVDDCQEREDNRHDVHYFDRNASRENSSDLKVCYLTVITIH